MEAVRFNILVLAMADPFYTVGPLLSNLDKAHLAAGITALTLMSLVLSQNSYVAKVSGLQYHPP